MESISLVKNLQIIFHLDQLYTQQKGASRAIADGVHSLKIASYRNNWPNPNNFGALYLEGNSRIHYLFL